MTNPTQKQKPDKQEWHNGTKKVIRDNKLVFDRLEEI